MKLFSGVKEMGGATIQNWIDYTKYGEVWVNGKMCWVAGCPKRLTLEGTSESLYLDTWLQACLSEKLTSTVEDRKMLRLELFPPKPTELTAEEWVEKLPPSSEGYPRVVYLDSADEARVKSWAARNSIAYDAHVVDVTCITLEPEEEPEGDELWLVDAETDEYIREATVLEWVRSAQQSLYDNGQGVIKNEMSMGCLVSSKFCPICEGTHEGTVDESKEITFRLYLENGIPIELRLTDICKPNSSSAKE